MAAPTEAGLGVQEGEEVEKGTHGLGLTAEDPIGFDEKNGEEDEEVPVAKKARVEKADNGDKEVEETELEPLLGHDNGAAESPVEGEDEEDEEENGGGGEEDEDEDEDESAEGDAVAGKDAPGNVGLRTLLQEGDATKTGGLLNGTDAETHALNGAK